MAIGSPKPVTFTQTATNPSRTTPQPMVIVGKLPTGSITPGTAPAAAPVPFADLTAAANAYNALRTALINAGVLA